MLEVILIIGNFGKQLSGPSNKTRRDEKIVLVENEEILSNNIDIAKTLHNFFSNVIKFLCNPQIDYESFVDEIADPSILTI